jgi:hypothetical protein
MSELTGVPTPSAQEPRDALQAEHEGWRIWTSDAGRWYATRHITLSIAATKSGYAMTVAADDLPALAEALGEQVYYDEVATAALGRLT